MFIFSCFAEHPILTKTITQDLLSGIVLVQNFVYLVKQNYQENYENMQPEQRAFRSAPH